MKPGDFVIGAFFASDNTCEICRAGYQSRCVHAALMGAVGTQAQFARVPLADGTLLATPGMPEPDLIPSLLAASDVLGTGWFAAVAAEAGPGKMVAVVGDGAIGLLGVLAASRLGADRVIAMSRHAGRQDLARKFGATDIVEERGDAGVARIKELTHGLGAHSVIEAVGTQESMTQAICSARPGGHVGFVGVSHDVPSLHDHHHHHRAHCDRGRGHLPVLRPDPPDAIAVHVAGAGRPVREPGPRRSRPRRGETAPALAIAMPTSIFNLGTAIGTGISATALDSPLGDLGPPVVGTIAATLIFIPLSALALRERHGRVAARQSIAASSRQRPA